MSTKQASPIQPAKVGKPLRKMRRMQQRAEERQNQALTESQNSQRQMEPVEVVQAGDNGPSMVQMDIHSDVLDSVDRQSSRKDLLKQIELLKTKMAGLEADKEDLSLKVGNLKSTIYEKNIILQRTQRAVKAQEEEIVILQEESYSMELQVRHKDKVIFEKKKALEKEQSQVKNLEEKIAELRAEKKAEVNNTGENGPSMVQESITDIHSDLLKQIELLQTQLKEQDRKINIKDYEIMRYKRLSEFKTNMKKAQEEWQKVTDASNKKIKTLEDEVNGLKAALHEEKKGNAGALSKISSLKGEITGLQREVKILQSALSEKNAALEEAQRKVETQEEEKAKIHAEHNGLCSKIQNLEVEMAGLRSERNAMSLQVGDLKSTLLGKNSQLVETQSRVKALVSKMLGLEADRKDLSLQVDNLESAILAKNAALTEDQGKVTTLEKEKRDLQSSEKHLKAALHKQQKDTEDACSKVTELDRELRKQKAIAQAFEQSLKTTWDTFKTIVEQCHAKFSAVLAEKENMKKKVQDLSRETERLSVVHSEEVSLLQSSEEEKRVALQQTIQEVPDALKASTENNTTLLTHNHELQETIRIKEDQLQELENRRKQKKRWFC